MLKSVRRALFVLLVGTLASSVAGAEQPDALVTRSVHSKGEARTLTDAVWDLNGERWLFSNGPKMYELDDGRVHLWTLRGHYPVNRLGAMGADREFLTLEYGQRLGVWANRRIAGESPKSTVAEMVSRMSSLTGGTWTEPQETHVAGIPVTKACGYDEFGNYYYEVIALERFGNRYAFATRVPYRFRHDTRRNTELAWMISHIHPSLWTE